MNIIFNPSLESIYRKSFPHKLTLTKALVAYTGKNTGRSPKDKRIVMDSDTKNIWWGEVNKPIGINLFNFYYSNAKKKLLEKNPIYQIDSFAGWDEKYKIKVRTYCSDPYHALFMKNILIPSQKCHDTVDLEIINTSDLIISDFDKQREKEGIEKDNELDKNLVGLDLTKGKCVIYGTHYAGEMKKAIFTYMMYHMPLKNVLPLHSSACKNDKKTLFFFGLSGTGKTTLSAHPGMKIIGDDEHVWTDNGIFNIEGGCYAKCLNLNEENEPDIYRAIRYGSVLENVILDKDNNPDYNNSSITENTRCCYPLEYLDNSIIPAISEHPTDIILLTCDAFGVIPPLSRLTPEKAVYYFLLGYTSKMPGTETGVSKLEMTFSTCFAKPFIVWKPEHYGNMLYDKIKNHKVRVWLVNTGWNGNKSKQRIPLKYTRAIIESISNDSINKSQFIQNEITNDYIPLNIDGIPNEFLDPKNNWTSLEEYKKTLKNLCKEFELNSKLLYP